MPYDFTRAFIETACYLHGHKEFMLGSAIVMGQVSRKAPSLLVLKEETAVTVQSKLPQRKKKKSHYIGRDD